MISQKVWKNVATDYSKKKTILTCFDKQTVVYIYIYSINNTICV